MGVGNTYDVIVVGAGSSGGVIGSRMTEDPSCRLLLVEAGPDFPDEAERVPGFYFLGASPGGGGLGAAAPTPEYDWGYVSEPIVDGRRAPLQRGKMVGGTSMINACGYVRGSPDDFEQWESNGAVGWGWADVLPYFERVDGAVPVKRSRPRQTWPAFTDFVISGFEELGYRWVDDLNDPEAWGNVVGCMPQNRVNAMRLGTLPTYVRWARHRPNFTIEPRALVDRIVFDGSKANGVAYVDGSGSPVVAHADTVVLSAGVYGSPQVLLRSGVGRSAELHRHGISQIAELPVGERIFDHPACPFIMKIPLDLAGLQGPHGIAMVRGDGWYSHPFPVDEEQGFGGAILLLMTDEGRGTLRLSSTDPDDAPVIDHRYADSIANGAFEGPWEEFRELLGTDIFRERGIADANGGDMRTTLAARVGSGTHPSGGCGIGHVVDPDLRVLGLESVFVADASVFPTQVSSNTNLTCLMIGERAADIIKEATAAAAR